VHRVAVGIGSNKGESIRTCRDVFEVLRQHRGIHILTASSLYRTKPVGLADQNRFINAAALFETALDPDELLETLLGIEKSFGRVRTIKWGPRTLDLDILYYGNRRVASPRLTIPHPLMHERLFVLVPLVEIDPCWVHPVLGLSVEEMLDRLAGTDHGQEIEKVDI